jgi:hypothetical protein
MIVVFNIIFFMRFVFNKIGKNLKVNVYSYGFWVPFGKRLWIQVIHPKLPIVLSEGSLKNIQMICRSPL